MSLSQNEFHKLYNEHKLLVYNIALHYIQNIEDAEEITQDVFIQLYNSYDGFNNNSTIKTWLYRITINKSLDFIKYKKSKKRFFIFGNKSNSENELLKSSNFEHPGILLERKEDAETLFKVINNLPDNLKTAFILAKIDGLSNPEVAEIMNISISAVESLVFRAKNALKEKLSIIFDECYKNNKIKSSK